MHSGPLLLQASVASLQTWQHKPACSPLPRQRANTQGNAIGSSIVKYMLHMAIKERPGRACLKMGLEPPWRTLVGQDNILQAVLQLSSHEIGMRVQRSFKVNLICGIECRRDGVRCRVNSCIPGWPRDLNCPAARN